MNYEIKYLPLAEKDLRDIVSYISYNLKAPRAALKLVNQLDDAISLLPLFPYAHQIFAPLEPLDAEYRVLPVKNYLVFYVVKEAEIEIHRIIFAKMDLDRLKR